MHSYPLPFKAHNKEDTQKNRHILYSLLDIYMETVVTSKFPLQIHLNSHVVFTQNNSKLMPVFVLFCSNVKTMPQSLLLALLVHHLQVKLALSNFITSKGHFMMVLLHAFVFSRKAITHDRRKYKLVFVTEG